MYGKYPRLIRYDFLLRMPTIMTILYITITFYKQTKILYREMLTSKSRQRVLSSKRCLTKHHEINSPCTLYNVNSHIIYRNSISHWRKCALRLKGLYMDFFLDWYWRWDVIVKLLLQTCKFFGLFLWVDRCRVYVRVYIKPQQLNIIFYKFLNVFAERWC